VVVKLLNLTYLCVYTLRLTAARRVVKCRAARPWRLDLTIFMCVSWAAWVSRGLPSELDRRLALMLYDVVTKVILYTILLSVLPYTGTEESHKFHPHHAILSQ